MARRTKNKIGKAAKKLKKNLARSKRAAKKSLNKRVKAASRSARRAGKQAGKAARRAGKVLGRAGRKSGKFISKRARRAGKKLGIIKPPPKTYNEPYIRVRNGEGNGDWITKHLNPDLTVNVRPLARKFFYLTDGQINDLLKLRDEIGLEDAK